MSFDRLLNRAREENVLNTALLELTYSCNLDCSFCYNDLDLRGRRLSLDQYKSILDEFTEMGVMYLALSGGEPLLYRHFFELGAYAREKGFVTKVKSNGLALNEANSQRLKAEVDPFIVELSIHGARAATHDALTQVDGSFDRLLRNIGYLQSAGLRLRLNSTLTRLNETEVAEMLDLCEELGVPLQFDPEVTPRDDGDLSPLELAASAGGLADMFRVTQARIRDRADSAGDTLPIELKPAPGSRKSNGAGLKACGAGSTNLIVDPFGNVYPCVQFRRKAGNVHEQSIGEIWRGSPALAEVRDLAVKAVEAAREQGLKQFCMGLNELRTGDPLTAPASKVEIDRIFQRVHWEERAGNQDGA